MRPPVLLNQFMYIGDNSAPADAVGSELACTQTVRHGQVIIAILMYVRASIEVT